MPLNAFRCVAIDALTGGKGWSTFKDRQVKVTQRFKVGLGQMVAASIVTCQVWKCSKSLGTVYLLPGLDEYLMLHEMSSKVC